MWMKFQRKAKFRTNTTGAGKGTNTVGAGKGEEK